MYGQLDQFSIKKAENKYDFKTVCRLFQKFCDMHL